MVTVSPSATSPPTVPVTVTLAWLSLRFRTLSAVTLSIVISGVGAVVSTTNTWLALPLLFPEASLATTTTLLAPLVLMLRVPAVRVLVLAVSTLQRPPPLVAVVYVAPATVRVMVLPASAVPLITGVVSLVIAGLVIAGVFGATASRVKLLVLGVAWALPAVSVWLADTATLPWPRVATSAVVSSTAMGVLPKPVTVLVMTPDAPVRVTEMVLPSSPVRVITPPPAVASMRVAPLLTPLPRAISTEPGAIVSIWMVVDEESET